MSDVRSILGPLFPGVTFDDADQVFVERLSVPVSDARTQVEQVWPDVTFADTDVLVVETSRRAMSETVVLPGELTSDTFDGEAGAAVSDVVWNPAPAVTLDGEGHAVFPLDTVSSPTLRLVATPASAGKTFSAEWARLAIPTNGYAITALQIARASNPANYYMRIRESGGQMLWSTYAYGGTQSNIAFNASAHRSWRIRLADQVYFEASGDGQTWVTLGTRPLPGWEGEPCVFTVSAGPWDARGVSQTPNLLEGVSLA